MRSLLALSVASSLTLLTGCGDESADSNCRFYIQQDLDNQNFDSAIARIESTSCQNTYLDDDYLIDLGYAFLGKSGYSQTKILAAALAEDDTSGTSTFTTFTNEIAELKNDDSFEYLKKAEEGFEEYLGNKCTSISDKTPSEEGICLIQGIVDLTKAALAIDFLAGDLGVEDSETLDLSICALQYTLNYPATLPYDCGDAEVTVTEEVIFTIPNDDETAEIVTKTFENITITDGTYTENFLQTIPDVGISSIVFTDGYCTTDFVDCGKGDDLVSDIDGAVCYVCPSQNAEDETVNDFVVDALNDGLDNVDDLIDGIVIGDDTDLQESIEEFKEEIGNCDASGANACTDDDFTLEDIIDYLDSQNN